MPRLALTGRQVLPMLTVGKQARFRLNLSGL